MNLSSVFAEVAYKRLVAVDLIKKGSHQHEFNGTNPLKKLFGTERTTEGILRWHYFSDNQDPLNEANKFNFYDARAKSHERTGRSEWRLYYYGNFIEHASIGDWVIFARTPANQYIGLIFQNDSSWLRAAKALFGISDSADIFDSIPKNTLDSKRIQLLQRQILDELELEVAVPADKSDEEIITSKFSNKFPTTKEMSDFARTVVEVDILQPDTTLVSWLEREESLFRALESVLIRERLAVGFKDVDDFISYSLTVQNRRKSRMGFALQNHLAELFKRKKLRFKPQARTEANNKPDFIFPGEKEYHDSGFDASLLVMLGVKSTSKDRWRQVLTEADRIPHKHLCTLEAGISSKQTDEMKRQRLTLVIPASLHETYTNDQRRSLLTVQDFIGLVQKKQGFTA